MKKQPKYLEVLKYLYEQRPISVHYMTLEPIIYSEEIIKKYRKLISEVRALILGSPTSTVSCE